MGLDVSAPRLPKRGDTVFVIDTPGSWLGGIVNVVRANGDMLVGVRGHHSGASTVLVAANNYLKYWCYPGDVGKRSLEAEQIVLDPDSQP